MHTISERRIRMLKPRDIKKPQMSLREIKNEEELLLLRDSIAAQGILQPLLVRRIGRSTYQLIAGQRRLQAALMAGLRRVPCVVHNVNECEGVLYSLAENLQNRGLSVFEEAGAINYLINKRRVPLSSAAAKLGTSQTEISAKLQVLRLEERIRVRMTSAGLGLGHAKALLRLPKEGRAQALDKIISDGLSERQAEEYVFSILNPPLKNTEDVVEIPREKPIRKTAIGDVRLFSNSISKLVDTLKNGGVKTTFKRIENENYTEYKIRIKKETAEEKEYKQLKIVSS